MIYLTNLNLNKNELQNARIQNLASDPASPVAGQIWFNTATSELKYYDGTATKAVPQGTIISTTAPTDSTAGKLGQLYLNTTTFTLYICSAVSTKYSWTKIFTASDVEDSASNLKADGTAAVGTSGKLLYSDHVHPTDTSRLSVKPDGTNLLINSSTGKIDSNYIPESIIGQMEYKGTFNAASGSTITGLEKGWYYICSGAGSKNPDGSSASEAYNPGDWAVYNGVTWDKIDNTDSVTMVNSQTGNVETYKGTWAASTGYFKGDIAKYDGTLYVCNTSHTSGSEFDSTKWESCGTAGTTTKYTATLTGDGTTTAFTVTHNMNDKSVVVSVYNASDELVMTDVTTSGVNAVIITFATAPTSGATFRVVVIG